MKVSESYELKVQPKNQDSYHLSHQIGARHQSYQAANAEKELLVKKIEALIIKNSELTQKQDSLQNTIYDLRKLLEFVGQESLDECSFLHNKNKALQSKALGLEKSLQISHSNSNHLQRCGMYWTEFLG